MRVGTVEVKRTTWTHYETGRTYPRIDIRVGNHVVRLHPDRARFVVDAVHDICDEIEREQREAGQA